MLEISAEADIGDGAGGGRGQDVDSEGEVSGPKSSTWLSAVRQGRYSHLNVLFQ